MRSAEPDRPCVVLCGGDDCAVDEVSAHRKLRSALLDAGVAVVASPCLGVCHGPVAVVVVPAGQPVVLERLKKKRVRRAVVEAVTGVRIDDARLRRHEVTSRKRRRKAVRRARGIVTD